jgi:hypothetical protein
MKRQRVRIKRERDVHTYCELWSAATSLRMQGRAEEEGSYYQFMGSLIFTAFSLEAFFNHIGPKLFPDDWPKRERRGPKKKLEVLAEKLGLEVDYDSRPWEVLRTLFEFRNDLAHGKSIKVIDTTEVPLHKFRPRPIEFALTPWEKFCTRENAERAREDVENIVHALNDASGLGEHPFIAGSQETETTLEEH